MLIISEQQTSKASGLPPGRLEAWLRTEGCILPAACGSSHHPRAHRHSSLFSSYLYFSPPSHSVAMVDSKSPHLRAPQCPDPFPRTSPNCGSRTSPSSSLILTLLSLPPSIIQEPPSTSLVFFLFSLHRSLLSGSCPRWAEAWMVFHTIPSADTKSSYKNAEKRLSPKQI